MRERLRAVKRRAAQLAPKRENVAVGVLILTLVVSGVSVAQESTQVTRTEDFEDGNADGWDGENLQVVNESAGNQTYSLRQDSNLTSQAARARWTSGPILDLSEEFVVNGTVYSEHNDQGRRTRVGIINADNRGAMIVFSDENGQTYLASDPINDTATANAYTSDYDNTWVNFEIYSPPDNSTLNAKVWVDGTTEPTDYQLKREFNATSGPVSMSPGAADYGGYIQLDDVTLQGTETSDPNLELKPQANLMDYGETQPYTVVLKENITGPLNRTVNVTSESTVTSLNQTIVTANNANNTLTATSDESVVGRAQIRAEYNGSVAYNYITVAPVTVENLEILPPIHRYSAVLGDDTVFFIILAILTGIIGTRFTTAFGGICMIEIVMLIGWFAGWLGLGMILVTTFASLFLGFNLAANIDYGAAGRIVR